jgi:hypothetical protein
MHRCAVLLCCLAGCLATAGCRTALTSGIGGWPTPSPEPPAIAADDARKGATPRTLPVELLFVRYDPDDVVLHEELWDFVDEQALGAEPQRRLHANGLRGGIVTGSLPAHLADRLAAAATVDAAAPRSAGSRKLLRLLPGRRAEVVTATDLPELVLVERHDDGVRGGTYAAATTLFAIEARPAGDGRVRIDAVPEIRHGPLQRSWVGEEGMFRLETGQRRHRLEELGVSASLPPQGMLLIGSTGDTASTVGDALLADRGGGAAAGLRLIVIRPLAATVDPLFDDRSGEAADGDGDFAAE